MIRKSALFLVLIVALLFAAGFWLIRGGLVERLAEDKLGELLQARVQIEQLDIGLFSGQIAFAKLQAKDAGARQPFLQTGQGKIDIEIWPLLRRTLEINEINLEDVYLDTERKPPVRQPAKPVKTTAQPAEQIDSAARQEKNLDDLKDTLPSLDLQSLTGKLDTDSLLASTELHSVERIQQHSASTKDKLQQIRTRLTEQDLRAQAKRLQADIQALDLKNIGNAQQAKTALQQLEEIRKRANQLNDDIKRLSASTQTDLQSIRTDVANVDTLIQQDITQVKRLAKIGDLDTRGIANMVFGEAVVDKLARAATVSRQLASYIPEKQSADTEAVARRQGRDYHFPVTQDALPSLVIHKLNFSGGNKVYRFEGWLQDLSSSARQYGKPTRLSLTLQQQQEEWQAQGVFDHSVDIPRDRLELRGRQIPLDHVQLGGNGDTLPRAIHSPSSDIDIQLSLSGDELDSRLALSGKNPQFVFAPLSGSGRQKAINKEVRTVFSGLDELNMRASIQGPLDALDIQASSNLDDKLSARLQQLLGKRVAQLEKQIERSVRQKAAQQLQLSEKEISRNIAEIEKLVKLYNRDKNALNAELDRHKQALQARIEKAAREKIESEVKDKLQDKLKRFGL